MATEGEIRRKRCRRWDRPFDAHFLTFSCYRRRPFFRSDRTCRWFLECVERARSRHGFHLWAWVIMPEHVHLLIWIGDGARISAILKSLKFPLARRAILWAKENAPDRLGALELQRPDGSVSYRFWQRGGGYDRNMRSVEDVHEKMRYIHENPLRRGLAVQPEDWPWSSWRAHATGEGSPIEIDRESIPTIINLDP